VWFEELVGCVVFKIMNKTKMTIEVNRISFLKILAIAVMRVFVVARSFMELCDREWCFGVCFECFDSFEPGWLVSNALMCNSSGSNKLVSSFMLNVN